MSTIHSNLKFVGTSSDFINVQKSLENHWKCSEVAWTFSEIPVILMTRQKSHAFVLEKVERYSIMMHCLTKVPTVHKQTDQRIYHVTLLI